MFVSNFTRMAKSVYNIIFLKSADFLFHLRYKRCNKYLQIMPEIYKPRAQPGGLRGLKPPSQSGQIEEKKWSFIIFNRFYAYSPANTINIIFFFVWADFVPTNTECCCFEPVHSVIIESHQIKCPWWLVQETRNQGRSQGVGPRGLPPPQSKCCFRFLN